LTAWKGRKEEEPQWGKAKDHTTSMTNRHEKKGQAGRGGKFLIIYPVKKRGIESSRGLPVTRPTEQPKVKKPGGKGEGVSGGAKEERPRHGKSKGTPLVVHRGKGRKDSTQHMEKGGRGTLSSSALGGGPPRLDTSKRPWCNLGTCSSDLPWKGLGGSKTRLEDSVGERGKAREEGKHEQRISQIQGPKHLGKNVGDRKPWY